MAMIDGIQNQIDPGHAMDKNIYDLPPEELAQLFQAPASLWKRHSDEVDQDSAWLTAGDVFSADMLGAYVGYKPERVIPLKLRPNPFGSALRLLIVPNARRGHRPDMGTL